MGSRDDVATKIDADTRIKLDEMEKALSKRREAVIDDILEIVCQIKPQMHKNYQLN